MARRRVALIGSGLVGRAWAIVFLRGGCEVTLYDSQPAQVEKALLWIRASLAEMEKEGLIHNGDWLSGFVKSAESMAHAVDAADHVQESIAEHLDLKRDVLAELDRLTPMAAVIASSTSAFMPSLLFSELPGRHRFVVAHPMNPPHLAPVVEICGAAFTYPETIENTRRLMELCGQVSVMVRKEIDGFVLNRLQMAVLNEAFRLVAAGYVSADDLDHTVKNGLALRWSFMGPLETIDLNAPSGIADYMARYGPGIRRIGKDMCAQPEWPAEIATELDDERRRKIPRTGLEAEAHWRDRRLMALARHKREAAEKFGK
jgi:3-hydroxyacyl-CoA dehydrogenase